MTDFPAQAVLARIEWGHDRARSIGVLAESLEWPRREVELAIHELRLQGKAVCSDGRGVWLGTAEDLARTIRSLQGRMRSQYATYKALRATLRRLEGIQQLPLPLFEERVA